jgi:hypothetical protein
MRPPVKTSGCTQGFSIADGLLCYIRTCSTVGVVIAPVKVSGQAQLRGLFLLVRTLEQYHLNVLGDNRPETGARADCP